MAGGKLTPRQKMINMMYLVLTALLAMNVSAEILNAFKTVNDSISRSNDMIDTKNAKVVKQLENERKNQPEKVEELMKIVKAIQAKTADVNGYIDGLSKQLRAGKGDDDLEVGTRVLAEGKDGDLLRQKLEAYKKDVSDLMGKYAKDMGAIPIDVTPPQTKESGEKLSWQMAYFHMVPEVAALTILNKFDNDVKNTEAMCMDRLAKEAVSVEVTLDKFEPLVSSKSSYVLVGDKYEATIGLGAYSTAIVPEVYVGGTRIEVKDGKATYTANASSAGTFKVPTLVKIPKRSGGFEEAKGELEYTVGVPAGAAVMLDKMNVIYIGVENPITISSGAGDEKTSVIPSGGGISLAKAGPGKYIAKATTPDLKCNIKVSVKDGKTSDFPMRVKRIPDPVPTLGGKLRGGNAQPGTLKAQTGIVPVLDNFDFEARFNVESYDMVFASKGEIYRASAQGPLFSPQMLTFIGRAKPKDVIYLEEIKVRGPDGTPRKIGQIVFTVQ
jgi:gliding motility-associated protein GldM